MSIRVSQPRSPWQPPQQVGSATINTLAPRRPLLFAASITHAWARTHAHAHARTHATWIVEAHESGGGLGLELDTSGTAEASSTDSYSGMLLCPSRVERVRVRCMMSTCTLSVSGGRDAVGRP
jgi:hypothetical protein